MNALDLVIVALAGAAAYGGWRIGFAARAASWAGMVVGLLAATRILPNLVRSRPDADRETLLLLAFTVLLAGALLGQLVGLLIGARLRLAIPDGVAERVDRTGGALAGIVGVIVGLWLLLPTMSVIPEWPAEQSEESAIAGFVRDHLPAPPDAAQTLRRLVGEDIYGLAVGLPRAPDLSAPPAESGISPALAESVASSTVKIEADGCDRIQEGSGAVVGEGLVITNAHVVAGSDEVTVERHPDGEVLDAEVVGFDPARDVAVLAVPDIDRAALPLDGGEAGEGTVGAVFGHPLGGPLELSPFQVGRREVATGRDIYGSARTERDILFLAASLQPGDSGGALVDPNGTIVGMAFAIAPDRPDLAYALSVDEIRAALEGGAAGGVPTGPCLR